MQAVAGVSLPLPGQGAELTTEAGPVSMGQAGKTDAKTCSGKGESLFTKLFARSIAQAEESETDRTANMPKSEGSEDENNIGDASLMSTLLAQLLIILPSDSGADSAVQAEVSPENLISISAVSQGTEEAAASIGGIQNGAETAGAVQDGEATGVIGVPKDAGEAALIGAAQAKEETAALIDVPQDAGEAALIGAAQAKEETTASIGVPQEEIMQAAAPDVLYMGKEQAVTSAAAYTDSSDSVSAPYGGLPDGMSAEERNGAGLQQEQTVNRESGQADVTVFQSNVAEKIVKTLRSMSGDGKSEQSFEETLPDEKKIVSAETALRDTAAAGPLSDGVPAGELADKSVSVEKALDGFLNDFRGAESAGSEMKIVLEPESLGVLTISIARTENGISAKIKSEDREVCAAISGHLQKLIQSMESKGVTVENVDVTYSGMDQSYSFTQNGFGSRENHSSGDSSHSRENTEASDNAGFFDLWQAPPAGDGESDGTVEYRI